VTVFDLVHPTRTNAVTRYQPAHDRDGAYAGTGRLRVADTALLADDSELRRAADPVAVLHRIRRYQELLPGTAITCPGEALRASGVALAVKKRGHAVDVHCTDELSLALSAGIPAARIVLHDDGVTAAPIRCAVSAGVGQLVIACCQQVSVLAGCAKRPQRVLADITADSAEAIAAAIFERRRLDLVGLHSTLTSAASPAEYADAVAAMVAHMAWIRVKHNVILTRVSLAGGDLLSGGDAGTADLRALAAALEDALDETCARFRFPRPALILAPR
jgi:diaminopimelate decarboxylase